MLLIMKRIFSTNRINVSGGRCLFKFISSPDHHFSLLTVFPGNTARRFIKKLDFFHVKSSFSRLLSFFPCPPHFLGIISRRLLISSNFHDFAFSLLFYASASFSGKYRPSFIKKLEFSRSEFSRFVHFSLVPSFSGKRRPSFISEVSRINRFKRFFGFYFAFRFSPYFPPPARFPGNGTRPKIPTEVDFAMMRLRARHREKAIFPLGIVDHLFSLFIVVSKLNSAISIDIVGSKGFLDRSLVVSTIIMSFYSSILPFLSLSFSLSHDPDPTLRPERRSIHLLTSQPRKGKERKRELGTEKK